MKKFYKVFSRTICSLIVVALCASVFSGCKFFGSSKLATPHVVVNKDNKTLTFDADNSASAYEVYLNEKLVETIDEEGGKTQYEVDFSDYLTTDASGEVKPGEYRIQVKAIGDIQYGNSKMSETISITYGNAVDVLNNNISTLDSEDINYCYNESFAPRNVAITGKTITWQAPSIKSSFTGYMVSIYSNALGVRNVEVSETQYSLSDTLDIVSNDVVMVRVSAIQNGKYYVSDETYYNPMDLDERGVYTDTFYIFKGGLYDLFIENLDELKNIYYYAFIYRKENLNFMVLNSFYTAYSDTYFDTMTNDYEDYILGFAYYETYGFNKKPTLEKISSSTEDKVFELTCKFEVTEPGYTEKDDGGSYNYGISQNVITPYYEIVSNMAGYTERDASTHVFDSDGWLLSTEVKTSEELLWAVTNHVTPIFTDTTSKGYIIYNMAKGILCDIIYDGMTDYEKALCIFDYIMNNSLYDWATYYSSSGNPMQMGCYYLEGFFLNAEHLVVCDSMSKTFALLCNMEGIEAVRVVGEAGQGTEVGGHAWNKVFLDGKWYVVDITWTEINFDINNEKYGLNVVGSPYLAQYHDKVETSNHKYFLVDDEFIKYDHFAFEYEPLFRMMNTTENYEYYHATFDGTHSRFISEDGDLQAVIQYMLKNDIDMMELVVDYSSYGEDVLELLKSEKYLYSGVSYAIYTEQITVNSDYLIGFPKIQLNNGDAYYPESPIAFTHNSAGDRDLLMVLRTNVALYSELRLQQYLNFALTNNLTKSSHVSISKDFMQQYVEAKGLSTALLSDSALVAKFTQYVNDYIQNTLSYNKSVTIAFESGTSFPTTSTPASVQQDDGKYEDVDLIDADFVITFGAVK